MSTNTIRRSVIEIDPRASAALRQKIEAAIEKLVAALDAFDTPAEDLEDGGDDEPGNDEEPSLAHTLDVNQIRAAKCDRSNEPDLEAEHDGREPSLGSIEPKVTSSGFCAAREPGLNQMGWACGGGRDLEGDEHDGREPDVDAEPLGVPCDPSNL